MVKLDDRAEAEISLLSPSSIFFTFLDVNSSSASVSDFQLNWYHFRSNVLNCWRSSGTSLFWASRIIWATFSSILIGQPLFRFSTNNIIGIIQVQSIHHRFKPNYLSKYNSRHKWPGSFLYQIDHLVPAVPAAYRFLLLLLTALLQVIALDYTSFQSVSGQLENWDLNPPTSACCARPSTLPPSMGPTPQYSFPFIRHTTKIC